MRKVYLIDAPPELLSAAAAAAGASTMKWSSCQQRHLPWLSLLQAKGRGSPSLSPRHAIVLLLQIWGQFRHFLTFANISLNVTHETFYHLDFERISSTAAVIDKLIFEWFD